MYSNLGNATAAFVEGFMEARRRKTPLFPYLYSTDVKIEHPVIHKIGKQCEYCDRINISVKNCEGCGAPCK